MQQPLPFFCMTCKPDSLNLPQPETHQSLDVFVSLCKTIGQDPKYEHLNTYQISITKAKLLRTEVYYFGHFRQQTVQRNLLQYNKTGEAREEAHKGNLCKPAA